MVDIIHLLASSVTQLYVYVLQDMLQTQLDFFFCNKIKIISQHFIPNYDKM